MDKSYYNYTLNFVQELTSDLVAAAEAVQYLNAIGAEHPDKAALTEEMQQAFAELASNCQEYIDIYNHAQ